MIIGLSGTNGSGKDTVGELLAEKHNFLFISGSDMLRDEVRSRGLSVERENLRNVSAEWRRQFGLGVLIDKALEIYQQKETEFPGGLVIASLRNPGEADRVHELNGKVIWVDADRQIRYDRITSNDRGRGGEDKKTFDQFVAEEDVEMKPSGDSATLNMSAVKEKSDIFLENNGSDIEAFKSYTEKQLADLLKS